MLLISAELDEIYALSDRILTLYEGRITGEYPPDAPPEEVGQGHAGRRRRRGGRADGGRTAVAPVRAAPRPAWLDSTSAGQLALLVALRVSRSPSER